MTMAVKGLAKLNEECGELIQVIGKRLAYYTTDDHPDGGPPLTKRLEDEIADVMASCGLVVALHELDGERVAARTNAKLELFLKYHEDPDNNPESIENSRLKGVRDVLVVFDDPASDRSCPALLDDIREVLDGTRNPARHEGS